MVLTDEPDTPFFMAPLLIPMLCDGELRRFNSMMDRLLAIAVCEVGIVRRLSSWFV